MPCPLWGPSGDAPGRDGNGREKLARHREYQAPRKVSFVAKGGNLMIAEYLTRRDAEIYASELTQLYGPDVHFDVVGMPDPVFGDTVWYVLGTGTRPTSGWTTILGARRGRCRGRRNGRRARGDAVEDLRLWLSQSCSVEATNRFCARSYQQGKITQARRVPSTVWSTYTGGYVGTRLTVDCKRVCSPGTS